jgi:hypothetical protein
MTLWLIDRNQSHYRLTDSFSARSTMVFRREKLAFTSSLVGVMLCRRSFLRHEKSADGRVEVRREALMRKALCTLAMALFFCLPSHGQDLNTKLIKAAAARNTAEVQSLLRQGADVNARSKDGTTALMIAKAESNVDVLTLLKSYGAKELGNVARKKESPPQVVDAGSFGIFVKGKRVGTEKFRIEQGSDASTITSELHLDDGTDETSEMRVAPNGALRRYQWRSTSLSQESVVEPDKERLVQHVTLADEKKRDIPYVLPTSTVILDDNFFSHREILIWRYLATGCDKQLDCQPAHMGVLVPHQHMATTTTVELLGRSKIRYKGVQKELNEVKLDVDGVQWRIWVDDPENGYKVIKMAIPSTDVEIWRE